MKRLERFFLLCLMTSTLLTSIVQGQVSLPYDNTNPVIYVNDGNWDVFTQEYIMALARNGEINLRGMIASGANHPSWTGTPYSWSHNGTQDQQLVEAAQESGWDIADMVRGTEREISGPTSTIGSPGTTLILNEARAASASKPLLIICGGPITNVVDAYLMDNSIADKMIIAWLAYSPANQWAGEGSPDANVEMGPKSATIALEKLKLVIFPVSRDAPNTPKSRMRNELQDNALRVKMLAKNPYTADYDADGQPAVSIMLGSNYVTSAKRVSIDPDRTGNYGSPQLKDDVNGRHIYMLDGNQDAGTDEWWRAVNKAFDGGGTNPNPPTTPLRDPENPSNTTAGLEYKYFEGTWSTLPNFDNLTAAETGNVNSFDLSVRNRDDNFGFQYSGFIDVPADGSYTFYTSSDDGSKLYIGSTEVVNNDGLHGAQERSGTIGLKAGKHALTVVFFEAGGGQVLTVSYAGPSLSKTVVPASALFRTGGGTTDPTPDPEPTPGSTTKITGTTFGTAASSWFPGRDAGKAFDGDVNTFFDAENKDGAYTGIDAGNPKVVTSIRFYPRADQAARMTGGKFQGSNTSSSSGFVDLYTITSQPSVAWQTVELDNSTAYRYLRYLGPNDSYGNVAEVEFYTSSSARVSNEIKAAGTLAVSVYPVPVREYVRLQFYASSAGKAKIELRNSLGQPQLQVEQPVVSGENVVELRVPAIRKGVHMVEVQLEGKRLTQKIVIQ